MFSRALDCEGVIAAFGLENQRTILSDIETFGLPISGAEKLKLPENLINLNRSLHSMRGAEHAAQKRTLIGTLNSIQPRIHLVCDALGEVTAQWTPGPVELLERIRDLTFRASFRALFGDGHAADWQLARLLQAYFYLRREATSATASPDRESLEQLVMLGHMVDSQLRDFIGECRRAPAASRTGLLVNLAAESGTGLSVDEIVGHMNIFFISATEPVAAALSWVLLVLSQLPDLRRELRNELDAVLHPNAVPAAADLNRLVRLDGVINETLRLLPPNALMVRITTRPASLNGTVLPEGCEVLLSPFVSHRDRTFFPDPGTFRASRWQGAYPSPFVYFPFGAGGHSCIGRAIALEMMKTILAFLLPRFDVLLTDDQQIGSIMRIMLTPTPDPTVLFAPLPSSDSTMSGAITGPLSEMLCLNKDMHY